MKKPSKNMSIDSVKGMKPVVSPMGQTNAAPAKPSSKVPAQNLTIPAPVKKPAAPKPAAKVKDSAFMVTPYGTTRPAD